MRKRIIFALIALGLIGAATNGHGGALFVLEFIAALALYLIAPLTVLAIILGAVLVPLALWLKFHRKPARTPPADQDHAGERAQSGDPVGAGDGAHPAATLVGQSAGEHLN